MRPRPLRLGRFRIEPVRFDIVLAVVLAFIAEVEAWLGATTGRERLVLAVAGPLMASTVAVRRRYPAAAGIAAALLANVVAIGWKPPNSVSYGIAWLCSIYALTVWTSTLQFAIGAAAVALPTFAAVAINGTPKGGIAFTVVTVAVMLLVRRVVGDRERRAQIAERERDVAAREAVVEERARIARELHDVIAHHVSMIVLQAGAERRVLDDANASTREVLETVEQTGRERAHRDAPPARHAPRRRRPSRSRRSPGSTTCRCSSSSSARPAFPSSSRSRASRRELPVGIELSAYRIVQEALTNALKHAGDARATVRRPLRAGLARARDRRRRRRRGGARSRRGGHGLVGMRERVALYGGRFDAGRRPTGGFAVRVLPADRDDDAS